MKLPSTAVIARDKAARYLLVPQARGDKSAFMGRAGYTLERTETLLADIRDQILPLDARPLESNQSMANTMKFAENSSDPMEFRFASARFG